MVALVLLLGGICNGLCIAQVSGQGAAHSCCHHGKDHCGQAGPSIDGHAGVAMVKIAPVILTAPMMSRVPDAVAFERAATLPLHDFSPFSRSAVLRI
jgi:hypothetical protein